MDTDVGKMALNFASSRMSEQGVGANNVTRSEVGNGINALLALSEQVSFHLATCAAF